MLSLPLLVKIFWSVTPTDMRKSFDSLSALVAEQLGHDPLSGHLFVFTSRRRDRVKLLYFEKGGLAIWYKRLTSRLLFIAQLVGTQEQQPSDTVPTAARPLIRLPHLEQSRMLRMQSMAAAKQLQLVESHARGPRRASPRPRLENPHENCARCFGHGRARGRSVVR